MNEARDRLAGLAFAAAGYGLLTAGDTVVKSMSGEWPATAIAALRYIFGALGLSTLLFLREGRTGFSCPAPLVQLGRGVSVALGSTFFFLALANMSIPEATVIQFVNPIFVAVLSAVLLKERAGKAVWLASLIAFVGVAIVIRPNVANIGLAAVFPLATALFLALMIVFNRMAAGTVGALQAQMLISAIAAPVLLAIAFAGHFSGFQTLHIAWPSGEVIAKCAVVACSASAAHGLIYMATERASAASIAPVTYVQLLVAIIFSAIFFDHWPDAPVYAGSALIIVAGLILWRDAKRGGVR